MPTLRTVVWKCQQDGQGTGNSLAVIAPAESVKNKYLWYLQWMIICSSSYLQHSSVDRMYFCSPEPGSIWGLWVYQDSRKKYCLLKVGKTRRVCWSQHGVTQDKQLILFPVVWKKGWVSGAMQGKNLLGWLFCCSVYRISISNTKFSAVQRQQRTLNFSEVSKYLFFFI